MKDDFRNSILICLSRKRSQFESAYVRTKPLNFLGVFLFYTCTVTKRFVYLHCEKENTTIHCRQINQDT
jgi:hypothetical protein